MKTLTKILLLLSAAACTRAVGAQEGDEIGSPAETKRSCAAAAAAISARSTPQKLQRAIVRVQTCADEGPLSLATLWTAPPEDQSTRDLLSDVSGRVRDRRIFEALARVAQDVSRPTAVRLAALAPLASLSDSRISVRIVEMEGAGGARVLRAQIGRLSHDASTQGVQPIPASATADVLALLDRFGQTDSDPVVRQIASSIARQLRSMQE